MTNGRDQPLLLWEFLKFAALFMALYYGLLWLGARLLGLAFGDSLAILGSKGDSVRAFYLVGVQMIGLGFGAIGFGAAAINRELGTTPFMQLLPIYLSRGPFQRGRPSREAAGIFFYMFFLLGCAPISFWGGQILGIETQAWKQWIEAVGIGRGIAVLCAAPLISSIATAMMLLPSMGPNEYRRM